MDRNLRYIAAIGGLILAVVTTVFVSKNETQEPIAKPSVYVREIVREHIAPSGSKSFFETETITIKRRP